MRAFLLISFKTSSVIHDHIVEVDIDALPAGPLELLFVTGVFIVESGIRSRLMRKVVHLFLNCRQYPLRDSLSI